MVQLLEGGAYLLNGTEIVPDTKDAASVLESQLGSVPSKEDAKKQTIAYGILESHNTSGNMEKLEIKFDKLTSHDITFVGIIPVSYTHLDVYKRQCLYSTRTVNRHR